MVVSPPADQIDTFAIPLSVLSTLTMGQIEPSYARNFWFSSSSCCVHQHNPNSFTSGAMGGVLNFSSSIAVSSPSSHSAWRITSYHFFVSFPVGVTPAHCSILFVLSHNPNQAPFRERGLYKAKC